MKSRYLINFTLVIVVLVLYWFLNQSPSKQDHASTITNHSPDEINLITIKRHDLATISLQKKGTNWQLVHPISAPGNNTRIKLLLSILNADSYAQLEDPDSSTLQKLGFSSSSTLLKLNNEKFQFGTIEAIGHRRYILHNDSVFLIDDNIAPLVNASAASFIDNKLIPVDMQIAKLTIPIINKDQTLSSDNITIEQNEGHWKSNITDLSSDQLTILIDSWQHAYAMQVIPLDTDKLPSANPHKISIWLQQQEKPMELELYQDDKTLYINNPSLKLSYQFLLSLKQQLFPKAP